MSFLFLQHNSFCVQIFHHIYLCANSHEFPCNHWPLVVSEESDCLSESNGGAEKKKRKGRLTELTEREGNPWIFVMRRFGLPDGAREGAGMDHGWQNRPMPHSLTSLAQSPPAEFLHLKSWYVLFQLGFYAICSVQIVWDCWNFQENVTSPK